MTTQNFLIGPIKEGLRKEVRPWATPEDSFPVMINAYQFRGRVKKRSGYTLLGKLANGTPVMGLRTYENYGLGLQTLVAFDTTQAYEWNGTAFIALPSVMPVTWNGTNSQFFYTTNYAGAFWATNGNKGLNGWKISNFNNAAGAGATATIEVTSAGNNVQVNDFVYFINLDAAVSGNAAILAKVTISGNPFTVVVQNPPSATFTWTNGATSRGLVLDSMQTIVGQDGIRYYAITSIGTTWANYNPPVNTINALAGALLIFPYRGYLVFLNTFEGNDEGVSNFGNRARWTQIGTPYYSEPVPNFPNLQAADINAARDDLFGRGGANDAPTSEVIVGAAFIRDILIVYFERSTWRLRFVNNAQNPFVWERVNVELGSSCTYSSIPFDKGLMAISNRGIVISDGNDTTRFDEKIPNEIFDIRQENNGLLRVNGIRTFRTKLCYWTFPNADNPTGTFPDNVLVYNYESQTWSFFDDCFTCFGYYYNTTTTGFTWADLKNAWSSYTNVTWNSGVSQGGYENIVAGNQQGYVLLLEQTNGQNDPSLSISAIAGTTFSSTNNNLPNGSWITISGVTGATSDDGVSLNGRNFKVVNNTSPPSANNFTLTEFKPINGGTASGTIYIYQVFYKNIIPGSVQINIGSIVLTDFTTLNGTLIGTGLNSGTIDYSTGLIIINLNPAIGGTSVFIRLVSLDPAQGFDSVVNTTGVYAGGGQIAKISTFDVQTKFFNFFNEDQRARLSKIDFYMDSTTNGQFTCNVFADASNEVINTPLPDNAFSNIVLTGPNPYQIGDGDEAIFRLYCDALAQTVQLQFVYSDYQMAVNSITQSDIEILALVVSLRRGGRIV